MIMLRKLSLVAVAAARSVRPRWHRPLLPPSAPAGTAAGMVAGTAALAGVRASMSAVRAIMAMVAAMCAGWSRPPGAPAGAWSIAAIDPRDSELKPPAAAAGGFFAGLHGTDRRFGSIFTKEEAIVASGGNNSGSTGLGVATNFNCKSSGTRHEQPHRQRERGD